MPHQNIPSLRLAILIPPYPLFTGGNFKLAVQEAVVVGEGATGEFLAVGAVAEDSAFVDSAFEGQVDGAAEAGEGCGV